MPRFAVIDLGEGIEGQLRASELSRDRVEDARTVLKVGEDIESRFIGLDRKNRVISLSIKAKEAHEEAQAVESYRSESASGASGTTLGDLLKAKISGQAEPESVTEEAVAEDAAADDSPADDDAAAEGQAEKEE